MNIMHKFMCIIFTFFTNKFQKIEMWRFDLVPWLFDGFQGCTAFLGSRSSFYSGIWYIMMMSGRIFTFLILKLSNQSGNDQLYLRFRKSRFRRIFRNLRNCWFKRWTITFVTCTTSSFCLNSVILASFFSLVTHNRAQKNIGHVSFCIKGLCKFHF